MLKAASMTVSLILLRQGTESQIALRACRCYMHVSEWMSMEIS